MIALVGLGPGDLRRLPAGHIASLSDPTVPVFLRTILHPAAEQLAHIRPVTSCDDLYDAHDSFDDVYSAIADRVLAAAADGDVIYAVPGSPLVAERSVGRIRDRARAAGIEVRIELAPSFLDALFEALELDPAASGFQLLDGRELPSPLFLHVPTVVFHLDLPVVMADAVDRLRRTMDDDAFVTLASELGTAEGRIETMRLRDVRPDMAGPRTSLFFEGQSAGIPGLIEVMRGLRRECPWDREQTHHSLARHAVEETFELLDALAALPADAPRPGEAPAAYAEVEEELGDVLLQVIFHSNLATEAGAFDIDDIAEQTRRKLVGRHPHVFGDVVVGGADEVIANWESIKAAEKPERASLLDGLPRGLPALERAATIQRRAASVGFDWPERAPVLAKVSEELAELDEAVQQEGNEPAIHHELGDLLFAVVNLSRHLGLDAEVALRSAIDRFDDRFRAMEAEGDLTGLSLEELDQRWEQAKRNLGKSL